MFQIAPDPYSMNAADDPSARRIARLLLVTGLAGAAGFGGMVHGSILSEYEARQFFFLTNPDGPAGDYRKTKLRAHECRPGSPLSPACNGLAATLLEE